MYPSEQERLARERAKEALKSWLTPLGYVRASLIVAVAIAIMGMLPNLSSTLQDPEKLFIGGAIALAGGFGAIALAIALAYVGGSLILYLEKRRNKRN